MSEQSLDEILGGDAPEPIAEEVAEPEGKDSRPRDEHGRFLPKQTGDELEPEPQAPEPESVTPTPEEQRVPIAALKDERQKRQELERQLGEVHNYLAQLQAQQQPQQPQQIPDMFEDPDGFKAHLAAQIREELRQELQPTISQSQVLTRAEVSEMLARQKHEDYDATVEVFKEALATNPFLLTQLQQAPDPATFAYNAGKQYQAAKAFGAEAPPSREQIEAELREKIMAEIGMSPRPQAPSTLADSRSVGARSGPAWAGPKPLGDLLG